MVADMKDMPVLQAEDDGFLLQLKMSVLDKHLETLDLEKCNSIDECVKKILKDSEASIDKGGSLPLYIPWRDDNGIMQGSSAKPVWAGEHIAIPLYGNIDPNGVEALITGNQIGTTNLYNGFMAYSPAFRVALLVHHICQIVVIHPMAAEAFVLGRYHELPFDDSHFDKYGVPATNLIYIESNGGLRTEWVATSPHSIAGATRAESRISSWAIKIRGSQPKEAWLIEAWKDIRNRLDRPRETGYTSGGAKMVLMDSMPSGRSRKRTSNQAVDRMINWVEGRLETSSFPMRGTMKDWKTAVAQFDSDNPDLAGRWTSDSMRKAFERRRRRGY